MIADGLVDPAAISPEERRAEIGALLAAAFLRLRGDGRCPANVSPAQDELSEGERFDLMSGRRRGVIVDERPPHRAEKEKRP